MKKMKKEVTFEELKKMWKRFNQGMLYITVLMILFLVLFLVETYGFPNARFSDLLLGLLSGSALVYWIILYFTSPPKKKKEKEGKEIHG